MGISVASFHHLSQPSLVDYKSTFSLDSFIPGIFASCCCCHCVSYGDPPVGGSPYNSLLLVTAVRLDLCLMQHNDGAAFMNYMRSHEVLYAAAAVFFGCRFGHNYTNKALDMARTIREVRPTSQKPSHTHIHVYLHVHAFSLVPVFLLRRPVSPALFSPPLFFSNVSVLFYISDTSIM